jgi:hypothetical protein
VARVPSTFVNIQLGPEWAKIQRKAPKFKVQPYLNEFVKNISDILYRAMINAFNRQFPSHRGTGKLKSSIQVEFKATPRTAKGTVGYRNIAGADSMQARALRNYVWGMEYGTKPNPSLRSIARISLRRYLALKSGRAAGGISAVFRRFQHWAQRKGIPADQAAYVAYGTMLKIATAGTKRHPVFHSIVRRNPVGNTPRGMFYARVADRIDSEKRKLIKKVEKALKEIAV